MMKSCDKPQWQIFVTITNNSSNPLTWPAAYIELHFQTTARFIDQRVATNGEIITDEGIGPYTYKLAWSASSEWIENWYNINNDFTQNGQYLHGIPLFALTNHTSYK